MNHLLGEHGQIELVEKKNHEAKCCRAEQILPTMSRHMLWLSLDAQWWDFPLKLLSQLPDLGIHSCWKTNISLLPRFGSLPLPHMLVLYILLKVFDLLDHMVIEWIYSSLKGDVCQIRNIAGKSDQKCCSPIHGGGAKGFQKYLVAISRD